ncbi:uncharacterized protein LOC121877242 [Homarus americanus]|uniref:uncharacterized protein LOC121877242 n=1 Tax=Homarus americanus TaxID=6706 RepID=UPI001C440FE2|nr:uncharacterized protein LOC121877242 [Homarus americanus]
MFLNRGEEVKKWGSGEYWGLGNEHDPVWLLTEKQKKIQNDLIEVCRVKIRPNAAQCDREYQYPRKSLDALAELGLLGLIVPEELGGLGENHVCVAMVCETIARYGCPSTAMVFTMHIGAVSTLLFRHHNNPKIKDILSRLDKEKLVGTLCYSDPATGGHFWFPMSSKVKCLDEQTIKLLKVGSWATSAGHADWYTIQTVSPNYGGDFSNLACFLVFKDEVRANTDDWKALGMHGNMSGPLVIEGKFNLDRMIGPPGDGGLSNDECVDPFFLLCTSSVWNGISLACLDIAKKHVTRKAHADVGMRVCDYPTIQDYFGECTSDTNASRSFSFMLANALDLKTNNNDWGLHLGPHFNRRAGMMHWLWQTKFNAAKNVNNVTDKMLHACGGTGYKTDLGIERLLRDGKAGWVMGPSNEVLRQYTGKFVLLGSGAIDYWDQHVNKRVIHQELKKMTLEEKQELAKSLAEDVELEKGAENKHPFQETDFENPFHTCPPAVNDKIIKSQDGVCHAPALKPDKWVPLTLKSYTNVSDKMGAFVFSLPHDTDHTGCFAGQYVVVKVTIKGKEQLRYFSPVSCPTDYGCIELVLRFETQGLISRHFQALKPGDKVEFQGPCGGFEYEENQLDELTLLASGGGITPGMQLIRQVMRNPSDKTKIKLVYFSENYDEILYREELDQYAAKDDRLKIVYSLGEAPGNWEGEEGFIDTQMIDKHVSKPNGIKHKIVMCGGPNMSLSCLYSLRSLGFPSSYIFIYGQFGTEQVKTVYGRNVKLSNHRCDNAV